MALLACTRCYIGIGGAVRESGNIIIDDHQFLGRTWLTVPIGDGSSPRLQAKASARSAAG